MADWMDEARQLAAQCWCDEETKDRVMDIALAEAVARRISAWMEDAAQQARNASFYRGLLDKCAEHIGREAFIDDDGATHVEPLRLKIPELVGKMRSELEATKAMKGNYSNPTSRGNVQTLIRKPPTVEELEEMLKESDYQCRVLPDGSVLPM